MEMVLSTECEGIAMKIKTSELTGRALTYAVALADNHVIHFGDWYGPYEERATLKVGRWPNGSTSLHNLSGGDYDPPTDWAQGGPIIEREQAYLRPTGDASKWECYVWNAGPGIEHFAFNQFGPTPLIAAMRCFVSSKLGDEVEVPDELCQA